MGSTGEIFSFKQCPCYDGKAGAQGQEAIFPKTHSTIVAIIAGSAHRRMPDSNPPEEKQTIMKDSFMMMVFKHWK